MTVELTNSNPTAAPSTAERSPGRRRPRVAALTAGAVSLLLIAIALDNGASAIASRSVVAVLAWWAVGCAVVFLRWPKTALPRHTVAAIALFAAATLFTGLSMLWAPSAERAFLEFDRMSLYLAFFVLAAIAAARGDAARWVDGLALGIAVVGLVALAQRLLPNLMPETEIPELLPTAATRLSYPLGYWNGLGILLGMGVPLLLRAAMMARHPALRGLAAGAIPILGSAIFLTSSRGGVAVALAGCLVLFALTARRLAAAAALLAGGAGAAIAVMVLNARPLLVDGPLTAPAVADQGPVAGLLILAVCAGTAVVYAALSTVVQRIHVPRAVGLAGLALVAVVLVAGAVAVDPVQRFENFKQPPGTIAIDSSDYVRNHLTSDSGSGRWQFWAGALDQWREHRVVGGGAGSFESWWAQNGSVPYFIRNAHSLWLETLGELGVIGFALLAAPIFVAAGAGIRRLHRRPEDERVAIAALLAALVAFCVGAAIDWVWQLPAIAGVAIVCAGLLAGPAVAAEPLVARREPRFGRQAVVVLAIWALVCAQLMPWLTQRELTSSRAAAASGHLTTALERAASARAIQPWAASPYVQLALVHELDGDLGAARRAVHDAVARDARDWRSWVIVARLATKAGDVPEARDALRRARALNPRSPLLRAPAS